MNVIALTLLDIAAHPHAHSLRVCRFGAPDVPDLVLVVNTEMPHIVGDVVAVARVGAVLKDGSTIRKASLRGVDSHGLTLDKVDVPPGTDLSVTYCRPTTEKVTFTPWPSIEHLSNLRLTLKKTSEALGTPLPRVTYRAKVKLDGTNAGIHALPEGFAAQSRTRIIVPGDDNYGFATWAHGPAREFCEGLHARLGRAVVFGEWCGRGIQKRTAISEIDRPVFVVFAIQLGIDHEETFLVIDPEHIRDMLPEHPDVFVLPWHGEAVELDFTSFEQLEAGSKAIDALVAQVETCDPWVEAVFGVKGLGEGVVLYPVAGVALNERGGAPSREACAGLLFKAKGDEHKVVRQKRPAQLEPEAAKGIDDFVAMVVTPARLEQSLSVVLAGAPLTVQRLGDLLKWIGNDIQKECAPELEASGLVWKQVASGVTRTAREWYQARMTQRA